MVVADGGGKKGRIVGVYNRLLIPDEMRPQGPHNTWLIEKLLTVCKCVRANSRCMFSSFPHSFNVQISVWSKCDFHESCSFLFISL